MKRILYTLHLLSLFLSLFLSIGHADNRVQGWCEKGAVKVVTSGLTSTSTVQGSYPSCTITVYNAGTLVLSNIYSDNNHTPLSNPFTADSSGHYFFYSPPAHLDIKLSGSGFLAPYTLGDITVSNVSYDNTVKGFGCVGDGVADDTACIQSAVDSTTDGGTLFFDAGKYLVKGSGAQLILVGRSIILQGAGWGLSQILVDPTVPNTTDVFRVHPANGYGSMRGMEINNLYIIPVSGIPARHGINLDGTSSVIGGGQISYFIIHHNRIDKLGGYGIATTNPVVTDSTTQMSNAIFNCTFSENLLAGATGAIKLDFAGDTINYFHNTFNSYGIDVYLNSIIGSGVNIFDNNSIVGSARIVVANSDSLIIQHNNIEPQVGSIPGADGALINIIGAPTQLIHSTKILDNVINVSPGSGFTYGINLQYTTSTLLRNMIGLSAANQIGYNITANASYTDATLLLDPGAIQLSLLVKDAGFSTRIHDLSRYRPTEVTPQLFYDYRDGKGTSFNIVKGATQTDDIFYVNDTLRSNITFVGVGTNDARGDGLYSDSTDKTFVVVCDSTGPVDTFKWSNDGGVTFPHTLQPTIIGGLFLLEGGISIIFNSPTGHTLGDQWTIVCLGPTHRLFSITRDGAVIAPWKFGYFLKFSNNASTQVLISDILNNVVVGPTTPTTPPSPNTVIMVNGIQRARAENKDTSNVGWRVIDHVGTANTTSPSVISPVMTGSCSINTADTDTAGKLTITGAGTCTITFGKPYNTPLGCVVFASAGVNPALVSLTSTVFSFTTAAAGSATYSGCTEGN